MKIHFHVNDAKERARAAMSAVSAIASRLGFSECAGAVADIVVALGGDGTILNAVHEFPGVPVLGLNFGGLGYLSSVEEKDFATALEMLAAGKFRVSERSALAVSRPGEAPVAVALNDIVVMREMSGHASALDLKVDGRDATRYMADGIIVATPTGSTAYSLSAGGPVLMPDSASFVVTPMNPHALGVRPMVVSDGARFTVTSCPRADVEAEKLGVYADGKNVFLLEGRASVEISKAERGVAMVELEGYDPYAVLARKLGWSGSSVK
jgi:NAD+ kinase